MKIYETENYEEMSRKAANILSAQVILKPDCVLVLQRDLHRSEHTINL